MLLKLTNRTALEKPAPGWHSGTVEDVTLELNSAKTGKNFCIYLSNELGQTHKRTISEPTAKNKRSLLDLALFYEAATGDKINDEGEFDPMDAKGRQIDWEAVADVWNGNTVISSINGRFLPYGKGTEAPPF